MATAGEQWLGVALWVLLFYPVWSPRMRRIRRRQLIDGLTKPKAKRTGTGPMWEQDKPYPECFEEDDDL